MFRLQSYSRLCLIVVAALLSLLCAGCGSSSSSNTVSQPQAQAVSQAFSQALTQALKSSFSSSALAEPGAHRSLSTVVADIHSDQSSPCTVTGTGENCDWQVSYSGPCSGGGTISVSGDIDGSLTSAGSGSIQTALTVTPTNCSVSNLVLNGDPNVAVDAQINFTQSALAYPVTFTETGAISYGSSSSQVCQINVTDTISSATSCTLAGTVCGQSVNGSC